MQRLLPLLLLSILCFQACEDDDQLADPNTINIRIENAMETNISAFVLDFFTSGEEATTFDALAPGELTPYLVFSEGDQCQYAWTALSGATVIGSGGLICNNTIPLTPGFYTLRVSCREFVCDTDEWVEE